MAVVTIKQLLESGIHFGHAARKCHYKMKPFLFSSNEGIPIVRNKIHIIDLKKTIVYIENIYKEIVKITSQGEKILFLGTKKQIQDIVKQEALRSNQYYIIHRWLGGIFTNFQTISKRINFLKDLYKKEQEGLWNYLPKKEVVELTKKREKLEKFLGGIKNMDKLPGALFVVDVQKDVIAIHEARKLKIPVFGIVDSNCDPDLVDFIIPANNDAIKGIKLISSIIANASIEGISISQQNSVKKDIHEKYTKIMNSTNSSENIIIKENN
ncbi:ribosomal protein S2 [Candidatus Phytoplasma oryzae]|uniref:Small ribosomal subunit protein uS2 n=1 Tax=Candidatus Phytoplasma oryzae TaxID=203274 RepID=A0A139JR37_9MOLU|nr:30S ribosomal protein S2 [Candidatus Phytoplasma oryzae]KXT29429.1 ribosomal protein S2 [Candidatus Phytoplasma oryzae]RAM58010.1 30S ribosomal protein S2 [Candidatus Phytoplasma oryzae]